MAKNDALLLEAIVQDRISKEPLLDQGEMFELFAFEQILKSYDLTRDEIESGWVDGKDDGGIDGFYTFINGRLLQSTEDVQWPRKDAVIDIWILSCKISDSFRQDPLNTLFPTIEEILDFSKNQDQFNAPYASGLLKCRQIVVEAFRKTAAALPTLNVNIAYACRGDADAIAENIDGRARQISRIVTENFSEANVSFRYFGASDLIALHRKTKVVLNLPYSDILSGQQGAFVLLSDITAYAQFVTDEDGNLRRYLFDSNVRDFLGRTRVNEDIAASLKEESAPDFWWLNNGVTILATSARPLGRTPFGNMLQLHDVQIVNGLQTTQSIYNHFKAGGRTSENRFVLIKVVVSEDDEVRDRIIQATNNQSPVELASLNATDKIQRDIEQILERQDWYYERRTNYYKNIGKPQDRFVTPLFLASALIALYRKAPQTGGALRNRFMRIPTSYTAVFDERIPISIWPAVCSIAKAVEHGIMHMPAHTRRTLLGGNMPRRLTAWRAAISLCVVAKIHGTFSLTGDMIIHTDISQITPDLVNSTFNKLAEIRSGTLSPEHSQLYLGNPIFDMKCKHFGLLEGLRDIEVVGRWTMPSSPKRTRKLRESELETNVPLDISDVEAVKRALPSQPWPSGIQQKVVEELKLSKNIVHKCVQYLIRTGQCLNQRDGVCFDQNNVIVVIDEARADKRYKVGDHYEKKHQVNGSDMATDTTEPS